MRLLLGYVIALRRMACVKNVINTIYYNGLLRKCKRMKLSHGHFLPTETLKQTLEIMLIFKCKTLMRYGKSKLTVCALNMYR